MFDGSAASTSPVKPTSTDTLAAALAKVGATSGELIDLLGSLMHIGPAYLVGSLGAGYGNRQSDIDVHVFDSRGEASVSPMMFFLNRTIVDVNVFRPSDVDDVASRLPQTWLPFTRGQVALSLTPSPTYLNRLSRWWHAVPLTEDADRLLPHSQAEAVVAASTRGALAELLTLSAVASLAELGNVDRAVVAGAWRVAATALLEVLVCAAGETYLGPKWVWTKAGRIGIAADDLAVVEGVRSQADQRRACERLGLPWLDPIGLLLLEPGDVDPIMFGKEQHLLVDKRRLVRGDLTVSGRLAEEVDRVGPDAVLAAAGYRIAHTQVDDDALDEALRS